MGLVTLIQSTVAATPNQYCWSIARQESLQVQIVLCNSPMFSSMFGSLQAVQHPLLMIRLARLPVEIRQPLARGRARGNSCTASIQVCIFEHLKSIQCPNKLPINKIRPCKNNQIMSRGSHCQIGYRPGAMSKSCHRPFWVRVASEVTQRASLGIGTSG